MPLFGQRPRANTIEGVLHAISAGECDDRTLDRLEGIVATMGEDDVRSLADALMANLVKYPDNAAVLTGSVKALEALPFLPQAKNEFIITLLLSLLKSPVSRKDALQRRALKAEVVRFLVHFVDADDRYATLMMPELIAAMDDTQAGVSAAAFRTLQALAAKKPEYFESHAAALVRLLGSINKATRAQSAKLIGIIARTRPEYVSMAMPFLQSLASFYPDAHVKRNANEAYQIIWRRMKDRNEPASPDAAGQDARKKGFVDIVRRQAGPQGGDAQLTDAELKDILELTRNEFRSDAGAILDSLGVGHLARPRAKAHAAARPKPAGQESAAAPRPKCPRCGGSTWSAGQICDDCASAEFDRKATRGRAG